MRNERLLDIALSADLSRVDSLAATSEETKRLLAAVIDHVTHGRIIEEAISSIADKDTTLAYVRDAESLLASGLNLEAEVLLIAVSLISRSRAPSVASLARLYESQSAYHLTILFTKELLEEKGQDTETAYQLSFALYMTGNSDEALEYMLPYYIADPSRRISRLCGLCLRSLGRIEDAIRVLKGIIDSDPSDIYSIITLSEIYVDLGIYQKALDILRMAPKSLAGDVLETHKALVYRFMGEVDASIDILSELTSGEASISNALWCQCFNYSISDARHATALLETSHRYWTASNCLDPKASSAPLPIKSYGDKKLRIGFLTADIGEHVVSRFLAPLLRSRDKDRFFIALFSTARRFEQKGLDIASTADCAVSLQDFDTTNPRLRIQGACLDIIIDTNGFTKDSGLPILAHRCAPVQCHYIGYHATTGLKTIDYFLGDSITAPVEFEWQYSEKLVQIPRLWMAYDSAIEFPKAISKSTRDSPVFGAFSQITKMTSLTLEYWGTAMAAVPGSILVIKDRAAQCETSRRRIENTLEQYGIDHERIYFFGPVGSQFDHLDAYNAIDIALDTTPWSGATTAFEALGMGVPLVAICGDTTSGRMSTSVVSAAGRSGWIARTPDEFARIAAELANDYKQIRLNKPVMQKEMRASILFDEQRICRDFYATIENLVRNHDRISPSRA